MYSGYVTLAYFWAKIADAAYRAIDAGAEDKTYYQGKIKTARFYYKKILPRAKYHKEVMMSGAKSLMDIDVEEF